MTPLPPASDEKIVELGRMGGLSDSVFAFAITLLVLDIRIPDDALVGDLPAQIVALAPKLMVYLISFIVIGGAWGQHQRMIGQIRRGDGVLVWLNLLSLLFVTLMPASANLLGRFPGALLPILVFAADVILIQLSALWLWRHASRYQLVNPALDPRVVLSVGRRFILSAGAFGLSLLFAPFIPIVVYILWIAVFGVMFATDWLSWQQALKSVQAAIPLDNALRGRVMMWHGAGHLKLHAGTTRYTLAQGTFGGGLEQQTRREGDVLEAQLVAPKQGFMSWRYPWAWVPANGLDWDVRLNGDIPLEVWIESALGDETELDFTGLKVSEIHLSAPASLTTMTLPAQAGQTRVMIKGSMASFIIHVPQGVAVALHSAKVASGLEVDTTRFAMIELGREYRSPDYDTATNRVEISFEVGLGSLKIS